ncbi:transport and Golgi organization protein 1 homolog isoform X2 [Heteronotia binoei]|uniref:transport and Golgi organization protein 1 homolog isoform X2 n=1 Tax=Heteronotia binoei TaxID=13085 RepID=UPI00292FBCFA|nr:transport and Golgi organization protein 1 homolog isoform X2 [Heteronotia binoei]
MAAAPPRLSVALPLVALLLCAQPPSYQARRELDRRFAEFKRCADPECSMLMCRGKAVKDFKGPDCRFVEFKEGESVYVYYKLAGRTNELWAGSVGSEFGYFPKDLLEINHIYTHDELELPTDETDFVCFDGGKDDFENYNADELLILSEDMIASDAETKLETEKEEETEGADPVESIDPQTDDIDMDSEESSDNHVRMDEQDNLLFEKDENVEGALDSKSENLAVNSNTDNPQGDQSAHQLSEEMQETLKVPEHESAKTSSISQGEAKQLDYGSKDDGAFTLLPQEVSEELKTKFGSTADALVSDDETTSLVTSLDGNLMEDVDDSYDAEKLKESEEQSEEIPLLSFTEEVTSSEDPKAGKMLPEGIHSSEMSDLDVAGEAVKKSIEKKDDSGLLINLGDTIFAIVSGGERTTDETNGKRADLEEEEDEEEDDEVVLINKKENMQIHSEETSSKNDPLTSHNHITKEIQNGDVQDPKEQRYKTQDYEEEHSKSEAEPDMQKQLQSTPMHNFGAFSNYRDGLESKVSMETKEETVKPPMGDIKDDPEGLSLHKIIQDEESESILEDGLENDTEHKIVWEELDEKDDENVESKNTVLQVLEELTHEYQHDQDTSLFTGKTNHDTQQGEEDFELTEIISKEKQTNASAVENIPTEGNTDLTIKQSKQETEDQYLNDHEDITGNIKKQTKEKTSVIEKSSSTQHGNFTQQKTVHSEDERTNKVIGINTGREKSSIPAVQYVETDAEEDNLEELEEELLQDENAISAKLSKERLAEEQSFSLDVQSSSSQVEMPNDAISRATNPVDEMGEEAMTTLEQGEKDDSMQHLHEEYESMQLHEVSQMTEMIEDQKEEQKEVEQSTLCKVENSVVEEKNLFQDTEDNMSSHLNISEVDDKDDFNETQEHLAENILQNELADKHRHSHDPSMPSSISENKKEAVEPEYSESVRELTIMKEFLDEKRVARLQKYLGQQHVFMIESLFHDMELELMLAQKQNNHHEEIEDALDQILESSESNILDAVDKILDSRETENKEEVGKEIDLFDEEAALMDDIQELMYSLRHKYSPLNESVPLASTLESEMDSSVLITANAKQTEDDRHVIQSSAENTDQNLPPYTEQMSKEQAVLQLDEPKEDVNALAESGTEDETEGKDIFGSGKKLSHMDATSEPTDLRSNTKEDFITGTPSAKSNVMEEHSNPSEADSAAPQILAALDGAILLAKENMRPITEILVSTLPEDMRPGPDFHGLPWEPVVLTALVGIATIAIFFWRTCLSVKSRMYQVTENQLVEKIKTLVKEKAEILEKMSQYDQKIREAKESVKETQKQNIHLSDEAAGLKDTLKKLKETNSFLDDKVKNLQAMLEMEKEQNLKKQEQITETQKSLEKLEEVIVLHSVELSEVQIALNEAKLSEEKVKSELHHVQEENARLKKSKEQLLQEAEGWTERHAELSEQIKTYQKSQKDIEETLAYKENEIEVLTNCIMQLKQLDADSELDGKKDEGNDVANGEHSDSRNEMMKNQIKQMMDVSRVKTTLSIIEEDRDLLRSKLNDEITARHELEEQIKKLEHDSCSLQTTKSQLENECKTLQQKVEILTELYQQKEMALQKYLTQEEYERQEKEQKLSAADEKAILAVEEVKIYKQRIQEMEEELQKTERSYKNQIASHEKKAHDNWLTARSAERLLAEEKREAANLRQKLIEVNKKIAALQRPLIVKPTPGRPDHQVPPRRGPVSRDGSFGPSPVSGGAPSPPLMMEPPVRPLSANPREGSRSEHSAPIPDGPPVPRRHSELSGRISAPDLGPAVAPLINCGPRTSSPSSTLVDGMQNPLKEQEAPSADAVPPSSAETTAVNVSSKGQPPFPGPPIMAPSTTGPLPPPVRFGPPPRAPYGPRPLPLSLVRGGPPPPIPRDYPPGPPFGMRDFPPGPLPPPEHRGYLHGPPPFRPPTPRDYPPRLPLQGLRDYPPPPIRDLPPSGPNNYQGPQRPPSPTSSQDSAHHLEQKP